MPLYAQAFVIVIYSTITILAVGGNVIVCYIVLAYQRMRTVTNYFIVNLALSDILMSVLCVPLSFIANVLQQNASWPFGAFLCPVVPYAQSVSVFLSAFTLVAISLDRYIAIIYPLRPRMTSRQVAIVIALIWMFSMAVPLPVALVSRIVQQSDGHGQQIDKCLELWPRPGQSYVYSMVVMVLQYFLPLSVLSLTYSRIGVVIWVKRPPGEAESNRDQRMAASKRKVRVLRSSLVLISCGNAIYLFHIFTQGKPKQLTLVSIGALHTFHIVINMYVNLNIIQYSQICASITHIKTLHV